MQSERIRGARKEILKEGEKDGEIRKKKKIETEEKEKRA